MMEFDNTNRGIISRNDRKETEKHPDFKGQINVGGVEYWLDGWTQKRKDGTGSFLSLSIKPKQAAAAPAPAARPAAKAVDLEDDIPF
jgi:uncharacterized protein (DUF736 family)